jgi:hypothetical protein
MVDTASPNASPLTDPSRGGADRCVCGAAQARTERHLRNLEELAEIGMDLARTVQRQADFADRPIGELVARICRDLGVTPDWGLFEDDDWAIEEARTRPPGSPLASHDPTTDDRRSPQASDDPPDDPPLRPPSQSH